MNTRQTKLINRMRSMRLCALGNQGNRMTRWMLQTPYGDAHIKLCCKDVVGLVTSGVLVKRNYSYWLAKDGMQAA